MLNFLFLFFILVGCQSTPTQIKQVTGNQYNKNQVIIDTRDAFVYAGFHISGSINLTTENFLILKNPKTKKRIFDPDIAQTIERLAKKGISPFKSIVLLSDTKDSVENKKWNWLLHQLDIHDVILESFSGFRARMQSQAPQALPEAAAIWKIKSPESILKKSDACFVNWNQNFCN